MCDSSDIVLGLQLQARWQLDRQRERIGHLDLKKFFLYGRERGLHSVAVLREAGYGDIEIAALIDGGVTLDGRRDAIKEAME